MRILAIETSCDETAAAVVENGNKVLSNVIASQIDLHKITGGVVPEVAAREHVKQLPYVYEQALKEANCTINEIDAIAATETPGLIGALLVGIQTARTLAKIHNKPYIPVNHINGHIYSNWLEREAADFKFPIIAMTVSGGHNNLYLLKNFQNLELIGQTQDDAAGEAFDKVAKMLGLDYPGGPEVAKLAKHGDEQAIKFPISKLENQYNFSFSGLKTSVLYKLRDLTDELTPKLKTDIAASFQFTVAKTLGDSMIKACEQYNAKELHLAGGVSANTRLRDYIQEQLNKAKNNIEFRFPKNMTYCTDNAAMIAAAAFVKLN